MSEPIKLHLGCGQRLWPGFINVDQLGDDGGRELKPDLVADVRSLPLDDDYADEAHAIHVLEHFYQWEAEPLLLEWKRVLKPGGLLVLELPCLDKVIHYITQRYLQKEPMKEFMVMWALYGHPVYKSPAMCHKWAYTRLTLQHLLERCGFVEIVRVEPPLFHRPERDMRFTARKPTKEVT